MSVKPFLAEALRVAVPPIVICDIGAMGEGEPRYERLLSTGTATVIGFEPNPEELAKLNARNDPRRRYLPHFLGDGFDATFHQTRYPGCSSLYEPDPRVIDLFSSIGATPPDGNFSVVRTGRVQTTRLDDVADVPPVDYLKLDIQGAELDVMRAGTRTLSHALVIECEVEFVALYKDQPLFGDVQVFLREHGFVLHKLIDVAGRAFRPLSAKKTFAAMSQMLWADAIFVRDFASLDRFTDEGLLKAAVILYEVYESHDLVHVFLTEHDRRRGTSLAGAFVHVLRAMPSIGTLYLNQKLTP